MVYSLTQDYVARVLFVNHFLKKSPLFLSGLFYAAVRKAVA